MAPNSVSENAFFIVGGVGGQTATPCFPVTWLRVKWKLTIFDPYHKANLVIVFVRHDFLSFLFLPLLSLFLFWPLFREKSFTTSLLHCHSWSALEVYYFHMLIFSQRSLQSLWCNFTYSRLFTVNITRRDRKCIDRWDVVVHRASSLMCLRMLYMWFLNWVFFLH